MSLNDVKISQDERFTLVKTNKILLPRLIAAIILAILVLIPVKLSIASIVLKIAIAAIFVVLLINVITLPKTGLYIRKDGKIKIVYGMSKDEFEISAIKRIAVNFTEWENEEFSAHFKFVFEDGEIVNVNYAKKFEDTGNHLSLSSYTMSKEEMEAACKKLAEMNICNISVIDFNKDITYQYIKK